MEFHHVALKTMIDSYASEYPFILESDFGSFYECLKECINFHNGNQDFIKFNRCFRNKFFLLIFRLIANIEYKIKYYISNTSIYYGL